MSEVFEALDKLEECAYAMKDLPMSNWIDLAENEVELDLKIMNWVETIKFELFKGKQALLELKDIKEVNLGKAMETLERIDKEYATIENEDFKICFNTIKQTLLKAQKQKKALEIIKNKRVPIPVIFEFSTYRDYLEWAYSHVIRLYLLTEDEFKLLKEVLCDENNTK